MTRSGSGPGWLVGQPPEGLPESTVLWDNWSINGEVCITGLTPPVAGGARLAHRLGWLLRELASHCRRTHVRTGVLAFTCTGPRTPTPFARTLSPYFDFLLQDARLIREHVRRRCRREPAACRWPAFWLEGATLDYPLPGVLPPLGRVPRRKLVVLAEARQVFVPARPGKLADGIRRKWAEGLAALARGDEAAVARLSSTKTNRASWPTSSCWCTRNLPRRSGRSHHWRRATDDTRLSSPSSPRSARERNCPGRGMPSGGCRPA